MITLIIIQLTRIQQTIFRINNQSLLKELNGFKKMRIYNL